MGKDASAAGRRASPARFLFSQVGEAAAGRAVAAHRHPFWQLEYLTAGRAIAHLQRGDIALPAGSVLLIPPSVEHGFSYAAPGTAWLSIKFSAGAAAGKSAGLVEHAEAAPLAETMRRWCSGGSPAPHARDALDHLLSAMLALGEHPAAIPGQRVSIAERVRALVDGREQQAWTVAGVARALRLSAGHCSAAFKAETGVPLKAFLDRTRSDHAARLLTYSDMGVGEIAALMGFSDAFAFSRFFSRTRRLSPSAFRERAHPG